jgi:hypothetical protein
MATDPGNRVYGALREEEQFGSPRKGLGCISLPIREVKAEIPGDMVF